MRITHIRVREGDGQSVALLLLPSGVIIQELPEIHLSEMCIRDRIQNV